MYAALRDRPGQRRRKAFNGDGLQLTSFTRDKKKAVTCTAHCSFFFAEKDGCRKARELRRGVQCHGASGSSSSSSALSMAASMCTTTGFEPAAAATRDQAAAATRDQARCHYL